MATTVPSDSFMKSFREYRDRAKAYAAKNPTVGSQHATQVRLLTLFRPGYGLPADMMILVVGAFLFPPWGVVFGIAVIGLSLAWVVGHHGTQAILPKFSSYLGAVIGYSIGITTPTRKLRTQGTSATASVQPQAATGNTENPAYESTEP